MLHRARPDRRADVGRLQRLPARLARARPDRGRACPQLLDDLGLDGSAGLPGAAKHDAALAATGQRVRPVSSRVLATSAGAALVGREAVDQRVAEALLQGAETVDEIVASSRLSVGAVLGALTRLEDAGLARALHGRYLAAGSLATRRRPPEGRACRLSEPRTGGPSAA